MRIKCTVSYDGSSFNGYQVQPNERTVQGELQTALQKLHKKKEVKVFASGRTDTFVHAVGQVIHFDTGLNIPIDKWPIALNSLLPDDVVVCDAEKVEDTFHARFSATRKEYRYFVHSAPYPNVFNRNYRYHVAHKLCIEDMREAAKYLIGTHDFTSFCSTKTEVEDKVRTIYHIEIFKEHDDIVFRFIGSGFLYNMVRILVGTLLEVGSGKRSPMDIKNIIAAKSRNAAGKTAPGKGLFLWRVYYDN
ncbi:tRNA pseudouridine(38-40) synthase TruA [Bacillus sp. FJAT-47783]|uniref:tRNA pseudouridine(38-40) synthase TruA n=1 Tax=Bacillus sp. FJAT-47783 TaxID=2922712 RepID=UPI001FAE2A8B|nr:tRNA pseudouridine(38-40) synthase TruA [Bacillus sp. FJAT-47783]